MTYYKIIKDKQFVGVASSYDLRRFQKKHNITVVSDEEHAQFIQIGDKYYSDIWLSPVDIEFDYLPAKIIVIEKREYDTLCEASENYEYTQCEHDDIDTNNVQQLIDENELITIEYIEKSKKVSVERSIIEDEFGNKYKQVIEDGQLVLKLVEDSKGVLYE